MAHISGSTVPSKKPPPKRKTPPPRVPPMTVSPRFAAVAPPAKPTVIDRRVSRALVAPPSENLARYGFQNASAIEMFKRAKARQAAALAYANRPRDTGLLHAIEQTPGSVLHHLAGYGKTAGKVAEAVALGPLEALAHQAVAGAYGAQAPERSGFQPSPLPRSARAGAAGAAAAVSGLSSGVLGPSLNELARRAITGQGPLPGRISLGADVAMLLPAARPFRFARAVGAAAKAAPEGRAAVEAAFHEAMGGPPILSAIRTAKRAAALQGAERDAAHQTIDTLFDPQTAAWVKDQIDAHVYTETKGVSSARRAGAAADAYTQIGKGLAHGPEAGAFAGVPDDALHAELNQFDRRWAGMIEKARRQWEIQKADVALRNVYGKRLARRGIVARTAKDEAEALAEEHLLQIIHEHRADPAFQNVIGAVERAEAIRDELARRADVALGISHDDPILPPPVEPFTAPEAAVAPEPKRLEPGDVFAYRDARGQEATGYVDENGVPRNEAGDELFGRGVNPYPVEGLPGEIKARLASGDYEYTGPTPEVPDVPPVEPPVPEPKPRVSRAQAMVDSGLADDLRDARAQLADMGEGPPPSGRGGEPPPPAPPVEFPPFEEPSGYTPRTLAHNELVGQFPQARSRITRGMLARPADAISEALQRSELAQRVPGVRLATTQERVAKAAGREQRFEQQRNVAPFVPYLNAIKKVKAGSRDDVANFWYAQLPTEYRNAQGLELVRGRQAEELAYVLDQGPDGALANVNAQIRTINGKLAARGEVESSPEGVIEPGVIVHAHDRDNMGRVVSVKDDHASVHFLNRAEGTEATVDLPLDQLTSSGVKVKAGAEDAERSGAETYRLLQELEDARKEISDLPQQAQDISASISRLDGLIADPPAADEAAIEAVRQLGLERTDILMQSGRLTPERAAGRQGLVSRELGIEPTGEENYIGHRLVKPENSRYPYTPQGGTGRVASPQGMSENKFILAKRGRLRESLHVASEDFFSSQTFRQALKARDDLGRMGDPYKGHVPKGSVLINPKARTIPAHWKTDELAQFQDGYEDIDAIREKAQEIVDQYSASSDDPHAVERLKQAAIEQGVDWSELRVVPRRLVDRYYAQYRPLRARGGPTKAYDTMIDAVATSIVFGRLGYIPKNLVQNLIMAVPHQGAFLPANAIWAAQVARDPELRHLAIAEIGHTGATGALGREAFRQKLGKVAHFVSKGADDPVRLTALMHEIRAAGIIPRHHVLLTPVDRGRLVSLFTSRNDRPLLRDIRARAVDSMADFTRMTPDQARIARRFLIIPGWLMAGTRYPFYFAANYPIRTALMAYAAAGEPGAPPGLQFNRPINEYFTGGANYLRGIDIGGKRLRTGSLNPVSTPWELAQSVRGSIQGKKSPFDYTTPTMFDYTQPLAAAIIQAAMGDNVGKSFERLIPNEQLIRALISPHASKRYPDDVSRVARLLRELGIVPVRVEDNPAAGSGDLLGGGSDLLGGTDLTGGGSDLLGP
jgi:hypothetical protein